MIGKISRPSAPALAFSAVLLAVVVATFGLGRSHPREVRVAAAGATSGAPVPTPAVTIPLPRHYGHDIHLNPPTPDLVPHVSAATAQAACQRGAACTKGAPTTEFVILTADHFGIAGPDGNVIPTYRDNPTWALTWHGTSCMTQGPPPPPGSAVDDRWKNACDMVTFIDATTGDYMFAFVGGPATAQVSPPLPAAAPDPDPDKPIPSQPIQQPVLPSVPNPLRGRG
jgi:hypothetical protein